MKNGLTLRSWIEALPAGPQWKLQKIASDHYPTEKPIHLYYRDGWEVAKWIFGNPVFANHMEFDPKIVSQDAEGKERVFTEYMSGTRAWNVQVSYMF